MIKKDKKEDGYLVMPIPYAKGMKASIDGHAVEVKKANGIMTAIPVKKGQELIRLTYTPPHFYLLIVISIAGIIISMIFARSIKRIIKLLINSWSKGTIMSPSTIFFI